MCQPARRGQEIQLKKYLMSDTPETPQNNTPVPPAVPPAQPDNNGDNRNPDGTFAKGNPGGPGRPPVSITAEIKRVLLETYNDPDMPLQEKKTHLAHVIRVIMKNAIQKEDQKTLKDIWSYIDGLPKGSLDLGVDREGLAELTAFMKTMANPDKQNGQLPER